MYFLVPQNNPPGTPSASLCAFDRTATQWRIQRNGSREKMRGVSLGVLAICTSRRGRKESNSEARDVPVAQHLP